MTNRALLLRALVVVGVLSAAGAVLAVAPSDPTNPFDPLMAMTEGGYPAGPVYAIFDPIRITAPRGVRPPGIDFRIPEGQSAQSVSAQSGPTAASTAGGKSAAAGLDAGVGMFIQSTGSAPAHRIKPEDVVRGLSRLRDRLRR